MIKKSFAIITILLLGTLVAFAATGSISGKISGIPKPQTLPGAFPAPPAPAVVYAVPLPEKHFALPKKVFIIDQKYTSFIPHVSGIPVGATVEFKNNDTVNHNVNWKAIGGDKALAKNLGTFPPGQSATYTFKHTGEVHLQCSLHPDMSAWIYVAPTPYVTVSKSNGSYSLANVPDGRYRVVAWHSGTKEASQVVTVADHAVVNLKLTK